MGSKRQRDINKLVIDSLFFVLNKNENVFNIMKEKKISPNGRNGCLDQRYRRLTGDK